MSNFIRDIISITLVSHLNELLLLKHSNKHKSGPIISDTRQTKEEWGGPTISHALLNDIKIRQDITNLVDTILDAVEEFQGEGTLHTLWSTIDNYNTKKEAEEKQIKDNEICSLDLKDLVAKVKGFKEDADLKLSEATQKLINLKSSWQLIKRLNRLEHELVKKWEQTRFTQALIGGENEEKFLVSKFKQYVAETETENLVASNLQTFLKLEIRKYTNLITTWKERYTEELSVLELDISEKEKMILSLKKSYDRHHEILQSREHFIIDYLEQKAEQDRLIKLQIKRIESAVKIQAWWKGVMVRKGFGVYKKKTKKGKRDKKNPRSS